MSNTKNPMKQHRFKWYHMYYFLAVFDVLTILVSLYLNHTVLEIYSDSVDDNAVWSNRVSHYSRLNELAAAVNAPGNDAFDSGDITEQMRRLTKAYREFHDATTLACFDLQTSGDETAALLHDLDKIDAQIALIHTEATAVFSLLENNDKDSAGSRMAEMDRCFSRSLGLIGTLCEDVRHIQSARFKEETARAQLLSHFEFGIVGVVCLIVGVIAWYGRKMAKYMRRNENLAKNREREITKAKQKAERLSSFGNILDSSLNEIYIFDTNTFHFVHVNHGAKENIGYTIEELREMTPLDIKPEHTPASFAKLVAPLLDGTQDNIEFTTVHRRKDGSEYPVQVQLETSVLGEQSVFAAIILDITERQAMEEELRSSRESAMSANQAKGEFLANMSHEIRTPMTAILGFTDILLDNMVKPENIDSARTVKVNGEYLLNLINDILDLSKIESGKFALEAIDCDPHQIVADVASLASVRVKAKRLHLDVRFDGPIPERILTDPTRLRQILINVVGNAIKFTETGSVQIVTRLLNETGKKPKLQFEVIDTGIGIPKDKVENIFNPFTQADGSTTRKFGGTGLGLSISKRLVELLGGEFSVSSTLGEGSTFSITVTTGPLDDVRLLENVADVVAETTNVKMADDMDLLLSHCRILLAEDGPDNQRLINFVLKKAGAEVTLADNGQIGLELAISAKSENRPFDVILMDMQMPVLDGYSATRRLREEGYTQPIIALTAHAMSSDRQKCLDAGCDDYTTKPIDRAKLISLIVTHVSGNNQPAAAPSFSS